MKRSSNSLKIKKWLYKGEFSGQAETIGDVIYEAGVMLDKCEAHEIVGQNLFQAADGKWYTATVEVMIGEVSPRYVKQLLEEKATS